jgi:hypothetical protein
LIQEHHQHRSTRPMMNAACGRWTCHGKRPTPPTNAVPGAEQSSIWNGTHVRLSRRCPLSVSPGRWRQAWRRASSFRHEAGCPLPPATIAVCWCCCRGATGRQRGPFAYLPASLRSGTVPRLAAAVAACFCLRLVMWPGLFCSGPVAAVLFGARGICVGLVEGYVSFPWPRPATSPPLYR